MIHGRYAYTIAPMGLRNINDELNFWADNIFADIPKLEKLIGDILDEANSINQFVKRI